MSACQYRKPDANIGRNDSIAKGFSQAASQYDAIAKVQYRIALHALQSLKSISGARILDIGCGTGVHTAGLQAQGANPWGVDIAEGMVSFARRKNPAIPFAVGNGSNLPFRAHSFDQIFSSMALQWCIDIRLPLAEVYRVLKPGGRATIAVMVAGSFAELDKARLMANLQPATNLMAKHEQWCLTANAVGFQVIQTECRPYIDSFEHVLPLLRSISRIGAGTTMDKQQRPPLSKADIRRLQLAYLQQADENGRLPLTYLVSHLVLEK